MNPNEKKAKRVCPLFILSPEAVDKHAYNCGSCVSYNINHQVPTVPVCNREKELLKWIKARGRKRKL